MFLQSVHLSKYYAVELQLHMQENVFLTRPNVILRLVMVSLYMSGIVGYAIPALLHVLGIVLLYKVKEKLANQRIITLNLAVSEMLSCLLWVVYNTIHISRSHMTLDYYSVIYCLNIYFFCTTRFIILHITIDRFLAMWLSIKYPIYVNKKTLRETIVSQWVIGFLLSGVSTILISFQHMTHYVVLIARISIDITVIIAAISTFIYLFVKSKSQRQHQKTEQNRVPKVWFKLKVPILIVTTFILFNASASLWWSYGVYTGFERLFALNRVLDILGWCSQAFIYIFLQKRVRRSLLSICRRTERNQVRDVHMDRI